MNKLKFYLGSHVTNHVEKTNVPLFISYRTLRKRKSKPFNQTAPLAIDSGGFTELNLNGKWTISPNEYNSKLIHLTDLGLNIEWASQQDYMCEPFVLEKTRMTIKQHQKLTTQNYLNLLDLDSPIHYTPVLQGFELNDYINHFHQFKDHGIDLTKQKIVGVGSVCRRQSTDEIKDIFQQLSSMNINLHGFGVKTNGLKKYSQFLTSCDSLAWSFAARRLNQKCNFCQFTKTKNCANCLNYALQWREKMLDKTGVLL